MVLDVYDECESPEPFSCFDPPPGFDLLLEKYEAFFEASTDGVNNNIMFDRVLLKTIGKVQLKVARYINIFLF